MVELLPIEQSGDPHRDLRSSFDPRRLISITSDRESDRFKIDERTDRDFYGNVVVRNIFLKVLHVLKIIFRFVDQLVSSEVQNECETPDDHV